MVTLMNLQAKYLPNKGKQIFLPKKETQCNHSALSNCSDTIMWSNKWNNSNSSSERKSARSANGWTQHTGTGKSPIFWVHQTAEDQQHAGTPNRPAKGPPWEFSCILKQTHTENKYFTEEKKNPIPILIAFCLSLVLSVLNKIQSVHRTSLLYCWCQSYWGGQMSSSLELLTALQESSPGGNSRH